VERDGVVGFKPHFRRIFGVYVVCVIFKMPHKTDMAVAIVRKSWS